MNVEVKVFNKEQIDYLNIEDEYRKILNHSENHEDIDYIRGDNLYKKARNKSLGNSDRISTNMSYWVIWTQIKDKIKIYSPFVGLMILEISFILDMCGTELLKFLH